MNVDNGQICGGAVAPNYWCPRPSITTATEQMIGNVKNLVVRSQCGQHVAAAGNFYCQDNFVMDRDDAMIAMPIPIVKVKSYITSTSKLLSFSSLLTIKFRSAAK